MNKLGYQVQVWTPPAFETIQRAPGKVLKLIDRPERQPVEHYKQRRPDGTVIARGYHPDSNLDDWYHRTEALWTMYAPIMDLIDYFEDPWNEDHQKESDNLAGYAQASVQSVGMIHSWGKKALVGNFGVGWPWLSDLHLYYPALRVADGLSLHEYNWPRLQLDGLTFRYRQVYNALPPDCRKPIFLTEWGLDKGVTGAKLSGWRSEGGPDAQHYAENLLWSAHELAKDPYVHSAAIFLCGAYDMWPTFDVAGVKEVEAVVSAELSGPRVGEGFRKAELLIGPWLENELWHFAGTDHEVSLAVGAGGYATWRKKTNETTVYVDGGQQVWCDRGNLGDGQLRRIK